MLKNEILEYLNLTNEEYSLGPYQLINRKNYDIDLINKLSNCQKYEFFLNENYFYINSYNLIDKALIAWPDFQKYNISSNELLSYFEDRLSMNISLDRKYFFLELQFNFCEQKNKPLYAKKIVEVIKKIIENKFDSKNIDNIDADLALKLCMRFIILSQTYNLFDIKFINFINTQYIQDLDITDEFFSFNNFFNKFFDKYKNDNKNPYYSLIIEIFKNFAKQAETQLCSSNNTFKRFYLIGKLFEKIKDYKNKEYFYHKEIDTIIEILKKDISIGTVLINQSKLKETIQISSEIKDYRIKDLKKIGTLFANEIAQNYDNLFHTINNKDLQEIAQEYYDAVERVYSNESKINEKLDYLLFNFFHFNYSTINYEKNYKNKSTSSIISFNHTITNHLGHSYNVKNSDTFSFFHNTAALNNNILVVLDENINWVKTTKKVILKDIDNLNMIDNYRIQFKNAIENFNKKKYIDFIYSAPTLIEILLKKYLSQIDGDFLSIRENSFIDKTLTQIIAKLIEDKNCYMDKFVLKYFSYVLVDIDGLNLRNNLLHGNFPDGFFFKTNAMFIYTILIYLIRYFTNDQD